MVEVQGNTAGLAPKALKLLQRLYRRRVPSDQIVTPELVQSMADASRESKRQVGVLIHRSGTVDTVIVGDATGLVLPDIGRLRAAQGRFRAIRLVHTHLYNEPLTREDLTDLTRLRLDLVAAILLAANGEPRQLTWAYNVPTHSAGDAPCRVEGPIHWGQPQPHFGQLITSLEAEFARRSRAREVRAKDGRAILVHVAEKSAGALRRTQSRLNELESLAKTAGVAVVDRVVQIRDRLDPKYVVGRGKLEAIVLRAIELDAETLIFDGTLTPAQASGISRHVDLKVIDRTQLILDIFAQRAQSRDGKLQVELAQLKYTLPRLSSRDDALSRLTGGIGGRGPGETKLEIGKRRARDRIVRLENDLAQLIKQRSQRRQKRVAADIPVVAIVGYTNAGKSTLLNTLTQAGELAEDRLFATLDPRARRLMLPTGQSIVLTDTVGFIRDMPETLFAAFRATFEEVADADLLLEVVDVSDPEHAYHMQATAELLRKLQLHQRPKLVVLNKIDSLSASERPDCVAASDVVSVSALTRSGTADLLDRVAQAVATLPPYHVVADANRTAHACVISPSPAQSPIVHHDR
jgi:GTP-binding protein HflX